MRKAILLALAINSILILGTSCKKCVECTVTKSILGQETSKKIEEKCGKKKDINAWEEETKAKAGTNSLTQETTEVSCITK